MSAAPVRVGDRLDDDIVVYRAFSADGFRDRKANKVRVKAYYRRHDHTDGLSVGLTPRDAVTALAVNFGYCSLPVGPVHRLPYQIDIRPDLDDQGHALICGLPFIDGNDQERERAALIAGVLARLSTVVTCDFYRPNGQDNLPPVQ